MYITMGQKHSFFRKSWKSVRTEEDLKCFLCKTYIPEKYMEMMNEHFICQECYQKVQDHQHQKSIRQFQTRIKNYRDPLEKN